MGMFNYVLINEDCPHCGKSLENSEFQTRDDSKNSLILATVPYFSVNNFYGLCEHCKASLTFNRLSSVYGSGIKFEVIINKVRSILWEPTKNENLVSETSSDQMQDIIKEIRLLRSAVLELCLAISCMQEVVMIIANKLQFNVEIKTKQ